jgi:hypothetical protein
LVLLSGAQAPMVLRSGVSRARLKPVSQVSLQRGLVQIVVAAIGVALCRLTGRDAVRSG